MTYRKKYIAILLFMLANLTAWAQQSNDTIEAAHVFSIFTQSRGYADRIALRWMPDEYVSFRFGAKYGYRLLRVQYAKEGMVVDTLAHCILPNTQEEFFAKYAASDSLAAAALQTVYGRTPGLQQTIATPGSPGSVLEEYDYQQQLFGYAAIVADMRFDLAESMGLAYTDRDVKPGVRYDYVLKCLAPDSLCPTSSQIQGHVYLNTFTTQKLDVSIEDSLLNATTVLLSWPETVYSAYDVERRQVVPESGKDKTIACTPWQRINQRPYISFQLHGEEHGVSHFIDKDLEPGVYEYRLRGYDSFGDKTEATSPKRVTLLDRTPPSAPVLKHIEILRTDSTIHARIDFFKDVIEPDLKGCLVFYNNEKVMGDQWIPVRPIGPDRKPMPYIPVGETSCLISCRGLETGNLVVAAVDTANNVAYSSKQQIRIADVKAPDVPANFRYTTEIKDTLGLVHLMWSAPEDADVDYYQINSANDTTHLFMPHAYTHGRSDTLYTDTVSLSVNQKYIYYKLCAVDFSTHQGDFTPALKVLRPSLVVPMVAHIDSTWQDKQALHIEWIAGGEAQLEYHNVYRRRADEKKWTLLCRCNADSVKMAADRIRISDRPAPSREAYVYAVESFTTSGISSGLSLLYSVRFVGYQNMPCPVKLEAASLDNHETRLAWDVTGDLPNYNDWYYCIYRKGPSDKDFKFLLSAKKDEYTFSDYLIRANQTAQYYITVMMPGIAESLPSNIVTITANEKK